MLLEEEEEEEESEDANDLQKHNLEALTKWFDDGDQGRELFTHNKEKDLILICADVNGCTQQCPTTETNDIIATTDLEGCPRTFLCNLKAAGMIKHVSWDDKANKLKIELNKDWRGALAFCGDLTSYKDNCNYIDGLCGNEIMIEVFEELLDQLEKHNKQIIKKNEKLQPGQPKEEEAKFVAVPGNHEFLKYWGIDDSKALFVKLYDQENVPLLWPQKRVLRVKVRAARVLAKIQKYYFEQALRNGYDINDDDYGDRSYDDQRSQAREDRLRRYIDELDKYIKDCEKLLRKMDNAQGWYQIQRKLLYIYNDGYNGQEAFEDWEEKADLGLLDVLKWRNNKLFSKMMLCHRGKKLRLLHSLSLFAPKTIFPRDWQTSSKVIKQTKPYNGRYYELQEEIGNNLNNNIVNTGGISYKYLPKNVIDHHHCDFDPSAFAKNKISTIWGHKCSASAVFDSKQVCFDTGKKPAPMFYIDELGIVYKWNKSEQKLTILRDQKKNIFRLRMPTAKTTIEDGEITQNPKEQLAEQIIKAIIEGRDEALTRQLNDQFEQQHIDNEFLISELKRYNENHDDVIKRYSWGQKFLSLGKNTARKRRINHLGKMLKGRFTRNMDKQEKTNYKQQYQQAVDEYNRNMKNEMKKFESALSASDYEQLKTYLASLKTYDEVKMKEIKFQDLVDIAKIHSRWPCCCCGSDSVEVQP